jgi:hypothetical protein
MFGQRFPSGSLRRGAGRQSAASRKPAGSRVAPEALEGPCLLCTTGLLEQRNLVSDQSGVAEIRDPNPLNPWGISESPNGGAFRLSDDGTGLSPLYFGDLDGSTVDHSFDLTIPTSHAGRPIRRGVHPLGIYRMMPAADVRPMFGPRTGLHLGYADHPAR